MGYPLFNVLFQLGTEYNAYEKDIAVVNIYYGKATATGILENFFETIGENFYFRVCKICENEFHRLLINSGWLVWSVPWI